MLGKCRYICCRQKMSSDGGFQSMSEERADEGCCRFRCGNAEKQIEVKGLDWGPMWRPDFTMRRGANLQKYSDSAVHSLVFGAHRGELHQTYVNFCFLWLNFEKKKKNQKNIYSMYFPLKIISPVKNCRLRVTKNFWRRVEPPQWSPLAMGMAFGSREW